MNTALKQHIPVKCLPQFEQNTRIGRLPDTGHAVAVFRYKGQVFQLIEPRPILNMDLEAPVVFQLLKPGYVPVDLPTGAEFWPEFCTALKSLSH